MRRIRKANIKFISLVPAGANKIEPVYKADGTVTFGTLIKSDLLDEKGELTAVVYAPNHRDSQGDIADAEVVKQMAYDFIANGASIDINHDNKPVEKTRARVAETFLVQKTDARFHGWKDTQGAAVDLEGAWATVIKIDDPELRKKFKSGEWAGVSMGGTALVDHEKSDLDQLVQLLSKAINPPKEPTMTPQELEVLKSALKEGFTELAKVLKPEVTAPVTPPPVVPKTPAAPVDDTPVFKGKDSDDRAVELHARAVELHQLKKAVDWKDAASIRSYKEQVAVLKAEWKEADDAAGIEETAPVRKAGPSGGERPQETAGFRLVGVAKGDAEAFAAGAAFVDSLTKKAK